MIPVAFLFLVIAVISGGLGLTTTAGASAEIARVLFVVGLVAFIVFLLESRRDGDSTQSTT